jgi:DNA repair exonuclease SbcCD ATPase subunit
MTLRFTAFSAANFASPSRQDIGQTIREAVQEAKQEAAQAAREAQQEVREAQQQVRQAQQEVRNAQQELRNARTDDQRGAANQSLRAAEDQLREAENELRQVQGQTRSTPMVYAGPPPDFQRPQIPGGVTDIAIGFFITCAVMVVGWPISRALGRRFERRGAAPVLEAGVTDQLQRIEQAVEAIAIEVERISESQRYLTKIKDKSASTVE